MLLVPDGAYWYDGTAWRQRQVPPRSKGRWASTAAIVVGATVGSAGLLGFYAWASGKPHEALSPDDGAIW